MDEDEGEARLLLNPPPPRDVTTGRGLTVTVALPSLPPAHVLGAQCNKDPGFSTPDLEDHGNSTHMTETDASELQHSHFSPVLMTLKWSSLDK